LLFGALTPLLGRQEGHTACKKNWALVYAGGGNQAADDWT